MMFKGLFREKVGHLVYEEHGGATIEHKLYRFFGFYGSNNIGYYNSSFNDLKSFFNYNNLDYPGEIVRLSGLAFEFRLFDPLKNNYRLYRGEFSENEMELTVQQYSEDNPNEVFEAVYCEKLLLDFDLIAKTRGQIIPVYKKLFNHAKKETSKRVFQGDEIEVIENNEDWLKIRANGDNKQTGWLRREDIQFWKI